MPVLTLSRTRHSVMVQRKIECLERLFKSLGVTNHDDNHLILIQPAHRLLLQLWLADRLHLGLLSQDVIGFLLDERHIEQEIGLLSQGFIGESILPQEGRLQIG